MAIDTPVMVINESQEIPLDVAPMLIDGRTLVPVRAVAEGLDADVKWDEATWTVLITKPESTPAPTVMPTPLPSASPEPSPSPTPAPPIEVLEEEGKPYKIETLVGKSDITKMQSMVLAGDDIYWLESGAVKKYDGNSQEVTTIDVDFSPFHVAYNQFAEKIIVLGEDSDGKMAAYSLTDEWILESYLSAPSKFPKTGVRMIFADKDSGYYWKYSTMDEDVPPYMVKIDLKSGKIEPVDNRKIETANNSVGSYLINIFVADSETYVFSIRRRLESIGYFGTQHTTDFVRYVTKLSELVNQREYIGGVREQAINYIASAVYGEFPYFLERNGTVYALGLDARKTVYIDGEDVPKGYEISAQNIKFWQFGSDGLPVWYDSYSGTIKRLIK